MDPITGIGIAVGAFWLLMSGGKKSTPKKPSSSQPLTNQPDQKMVREDVYHGTSQKSFDCILQEKAIVVGNRNFYSSGSYWTTQKKEARLYSGRKGRIVEGEIECPEDQIADYKRIKSSPEFKKWKRKSGIYNEGDAITEYCLTVQKKRFLRAPGNTIVALAHKTKPGERVKIQGLKIK